MTKAARAALLAAGLALAGSPALADPPHGKQGRGGPPGLAKKGGLPPGQAKKMYRQGERLPSSHYAERYFVAEPSRYALPPPPPGYRWVQYGEDAYLVQTRDGLIADIVRSLFN
jgi:Ni/Co efflux regulator RcnB